MTGTQRQPAPQGAVEVPVGEHFALVDEADAELVTGYRWWPMYGTTGKVYAFTTIGRKTLLMHRHVAGTAADMDTDHRDGNGLNNCRSNLRSATRAQNSVNADKPRRRDGQPFSSRYKGVFFNKSRKKFQANIRANGRRFYLGAYASEVDAARAYDEAARELHGMFARPNFPDEVSR